jgi:DNA (cytosine-5)-methyltransferase 1
MGAKPLYVDLFAGCGGLSLGLEQAGFELALAVEKSPMAAETFYHNFVGRISTDGEWERYCALGVEDQAKSKLVVKELAAVLACAPLLSRLRKQDIDLVAGGPPCQGFSLAGRRNPDDVRNQLPWQFLEFVEAVNPKAVVIENVSGMSQDFKKHGKESPFDQLRVALQATGPGYEVQPVLLNAMHFGVPQHRPRVMLLALRRDVAAKAGFESSKHTWKSDFDQVSSLLFPQRPKIAPIATHFGDAILTVADAIADLDPKGYARRKNISAFASEMREDDTWLPLELRGTQKQAKPANHTLRKHAHNIETRFRLYQYLRDENIPPKVLGLPKTRDVTEEGARVLVSQAIKSARTPAIAPDGTTIAKSKGDLVKLVMSLGTKKHSQRPLSWSSPSPTVVSLPDDYVHPEEPRTLTVREMARFQSFPDSFVFRAKETTGSLRRRVEVPQYTQVGNAVPPKLGKAVGLSIFNALAIASAAQPARRKKAS